MAQQPPADMVYLALPADLDEALQVWIDAQDEPIARADAIRYALRDWLTGLRYLPFSDDPEMAN